MKKDDCIFCKIANGEIPSATVFQINGLRVFLDVAPANKGHALVVPMDHYDNIFDMDTESAKAIFANVPEIARAIKDELKCEGMNIVQNNGEVAGQTVNHFHIHLIPRFKDDGVKLTWAQQETDPEEQQKLAKAIHDRILEIADRGKID